MAGATAQAERGLVTSSVDPEVTAAIAIYDRLEPLKNALGVGDLSVPELQLFAMVAHRTGLDPFTRQIYAIKRAGKVTHQTGIDGYRSVAERTTQYLGSDEPTYEGPCSCGAKPQDHPAVARVTVHRAHPSGHVVDQVGVARWHELVPPSGQDSMWQKMPFNQLAKCAEANGLRKAFPRVLGGVYITEEMEQAGAPESAPLVEAAAKPTAGERLAARRAAIAGEVIEHLPNATPAEVDGAAAASPGPVAPSPAAPPEWAQAETSEGLSLVELLQKSVEASELEGPMTVPQKGRVGELIGQASGLEWTTEALPVLAAAFGDGFEPRDMTAAQAQAVANLADALAAAEPPIDFAEAWRSAAKED